jgi:hypothetical protein
MVIVAPTRKLQHSEEVELLPFKLIPECPFHARKLPAEVGRQTSP